MGTQSPEGVLGAPRGLKAPEHIWSPGRYSESWRVIIALRGYWEPQGDTGSPEGILGAPRGYWEPPGDSEPRRILRVQGVLRALVGSWIPGGY